MCGGMLVVNLFAKGEIRTTLTKDNMVRILFALYLDIICSILLNVKYCWKIPCFLKERINLVHVITNRCPSWDFKAWDVIDAKIIAFHQFDRQIMNHRNKISQGRYKVILVINISKLTENYQDNNFIRTVNDHYMNNNTTLFKIRSIWRQSNRIIEYICTKHITNLASYPLCFYSKVSQWLIYNKKKKGGLMYMERTWDPSKHYVDQSGGWQE